MNKKDNDLLDNMLQNDNLPKPKLKNNKMILLIIVFIIGISFLITALILMLTVGRVNENTDQNIIEEEFNPIPLNEDLNFTEEEHRQFSCEVATQSMVLATNNGLPIQNTDQVVLFGYGTNNTVYGSTSTTKIYKKGTSNIITPITVLEGFENKIKENNNKFIYIKNEIGYEVGQFDINENQNLTEYDIESFSIKREGAKRSVAVMTVSRKPVERNELYPDNSNNYNTNLTDIEIETYTLLKKYFDHIVIVLNVGTVIELNDIENDNKTSILISFYPGVEAGNAIADILLGDVNPSGHLSNTWAKTINDYPTTLTFMESQKYVKYKEGLFIGYRYFEDDEEKQSKIVFPFGHGLSYTNFKIENNIEFNSGNFIITSKVINIGKRSGKYVIQVYVRKPQNENFIKVQRELIAFGKTKELKENEFQTLNIKFNLEDLASYDDTGVTGNPACYILEKGDYEIYIGDSVADTRNLNKLIYTYSNKELKVIQKLINRLVPQDDDVFDSNKKPNFENFTYKDNQTLDSFSNSDISNIYKEINLKNMLVNDGKYIYSEIPTNKFNEINFKNILLKKYNMEQLVDSMTNEELAFLSLGKPGYIIGGKGGIGGFYNSGITGKYNIPFGDILNGPEGLYQSEITLSSTSWPCATGLASSFDIELIEKVGEKIGKEARKLGCYFWISPGINIHRNPLSHKNYEKFSEDPILSGKLAASLTKGVQSKRVSIILNNFAFHNKFESSNGEYVSNNIVIDSRMSERVAREIYLKSFEIAIKEGNPWSIMTSNNRINNIKTSESYDLLTSILRDEWKYEGLVMTGWYSQSSHDREAHAGISVKMPNNKPDETKTILNGLIKGTVTRDNLKRTILYLLNNLAKTACIDSLFIETKKKIIIKDGKMRIKVIDYIYRKYNGIYHEKCNDEDGGYIPTNIIPNNWISFYIENDKEQYRKVRIRYSCAVEGFGIGFNKYDEFLGEIIDLAPTGKYDIWKTSNAVTIKLPKGSYEFTMRILGNEFTSSNYYDKGRINWIEFL